MSKEKNWDSYIGQHRVKEELKMRIEASVTGHEPLGHILLAHPVPGTGKSSLARLIHQMYNQTYPSKLHTMSPPFKRERFTEVMQELQRWDIVFIDEIHKMADGGAKFAEILLHVLEDRKHYVNGSAIDLPPFTLIGATTDKAKLPEPVLSRFRIQPRFTGYSQDEMSQIVLQFSRKQNLNLSSDEQKVIASAAGGVPRMARILVETAKDHYLATGHHDVPKVLSYYSLDPDGLDDDHRKYLLILKRHNKPLGQAALCSLMRVQKVGLLRIERLLSDLGFISYTATGRLLTQKGMRRAEIAAKQAATPTQAAGLR